MSQTEQREFDYTPLRSELVIARAIFKGAWRWEPREMILALWQAILLASSPALAFSIQQCTSSCLRDRFPISLSEHERRDLGAMTKGSASVDLKIQFDTGTANVSQESLSSLNALGEALSKMSGTTFVISVFVDEKDDVNNKNIAILRAETIKRYLVSRYQIEPADLVTTFFSGKMPSFCCVRILNTHIEPAPH